MSKTLLFIRVASCLLIFPVWGCVRSGNADLGKIGLPSLSNSKGPQNNGDGYTGGGGATYYRRSPGHYCARDGQPLWSYEKSVFVQDVHVFDTGNLCEPAYIPIDSAPISFFGPNNDWLVYQGGIFEALVSAPASDTKPLPAVTLCRSRNDSPKIELVVRPTDDGSFSAHLYVYEQTSPREADVSSLVRSQPEAHTQYESGSFGLDVPTDNGQSAQLHATVGNVTYETAMDCISEPE